MILRLRQKSPKDGDRFILFDSYEDISFPLNIGDLIKLKSEKDHRLWEVTYFDEKGIRWNNHPSYLRSL